MKYEPENSDLPVQCTGCGWTGKLEQTEDEDVLTPEFQLFGLHCICPKCGAAVSPVVGVSGRSPDVAKR